MKKIELKIGGLDINLELLKKEGKHSFIIKPERGKHNEYTDPFSIYATVIREGGFHCQYVFKRFKIRDNVGGGDLFVNEKNDLVFYNGGGELHGGAPKALIKKFGELIIPELKNKGIEIRKVTPLNSVEHELSSFWIDKGYFTTKPLVEF